MQLIIDLPNREDQIAFNRERWAELISDRSLSGLPNKIETNGYGQILMNPPPTFDHSFRQSKIHLKLNELLGDQSFTECPISTIDGVKGADVVWYSQDRFQSVRDQEVCETAAEICVEVIFRSNTRREMTQKKSLYFEAGALEVWFCTIDGTMEFYSVDQPDERLATSAMCPNFPRQIQ